MTDGPTGHDAGSASWLARVSYEELPDGLRNALAPRVERLGYFGEFFQCAAHQPETLLAFVEYTERGKAALSENVVEVIALTAARHLGNAYELNQHERLSVRLGFGHEWVSEVERLDPDSAKLSDEECVVQRYVMSALASGGHGSSGELAEVARHIGAAPAIAVMLVLGRYLVHSLFVNSLEIAPPVPSIFEDGFANEV